MAKNIKRLEDSSFDARKKVYIGALRQFASKFYIYGMGTILEKYGIVKEKVGYEYANRFIFDCFAGETSKFFFSQKPAKYKHLGLLPLAYYCNYLQGLYDALIEYADKNYSTDMLAFERVTRKYSTKFKKENQMPRIIPRPEVNSTKFDNETKKAYQTYEGISKLMVERNLNEEILKMIEDADYYQKQEFWLDLNFFEKRFKYLANKVFDGQKYVDLNKLITKEDIEKFYEEQTSKKSYDKNYAIPDEEYEMEDNVFEM